MYFKTRIIEKSLLLKNNIYKNEIILDEIQVYNGTKISVNGHFSDFSVQHMTLQMKFGHFFSKLKIILSLKFGTLNREIK